MEERERGNDQLITVPEKCVVGSGWRWEGVDGVDECGIGGGEGELRCVVGVWTVP